jgi:hypothetical protein
MPNYSVSRTISIKASKEHLFNSLANLNEWKEWSLWLIQEPEAEVTTSEDHKTHEWKGNRLGHGKLTVVNELPYRKIDYVLQYFKPWKSVSDTSFIIEYDGEKTKVTWTMDGKLPFYMFWMKGMMKVFLGMDYERGLNMLKEYIELGKPNTQLNFNGQSIFQGINYVGIKRTCSLEELKDSMPKDIASLVEYLDAKDAISGPCFSIYHKW